MSSVEERMPAEEERSIALRSGPQIVVARHQESEIDEAQGLNLAAFWHAFRRRWKVAIPIGMLLSVVAGVLAWKLIVPKYSASAFLQIDADNRPLIFETADQGGGTGAIGFKLYKNTQQQIMLTPFVLNAALRDEGVKNLPIVASSPDAVSWLQEELSVKFPADGEIMQVSLETADPTSCVKLVNAVVNAYMNEVVVSERNERLKRLDNLERVYAEAETKVRNKRAELKTLAAALGTGDSESLTVAQQSTLQQFGLMQEKLSDVQYQLMQAQGEIKILQDLQTRLASADESKAEVVPADSAPEEEVVPEILESDLRTPDIVRIEGQLASLQAKLSSSQSVYGAKHPSIRRIMEEIKVTEELLVRYKEAAETRARELAQERQVQKLSEDARSGIITKNGSTMVDPDRIVALAAKIEMLQSQEKTMQEKVDALSAEAKQLGRSSVDVELMRSEITGLEEVLSRVGAEVEKRTSSLRQVPESRWLTQRRSPLHGCEEAYRGDYWP